MTTLLSTPSVSPVLICVVLLCLALLRSWVRAKGRHLPPGPKRLPIIGNALQVPLECQELTFAEWGSRFGDVIYARLFQKHVIVLNSVHAARELLEKRGAIYSDRPRFVMFAELIKAFHPNMSLMNYGDAWRQQRKWFQTTISTRTALDSFQPVQQREVVQFLSELLRTPQDFASHIKRFTAGILFEISYGHTVTSNDDDLVVKADETITGILEAGGAGSTLVDFAPILQYIPAWLPGAGFKRNALKLRRSAFEAMNVPFMRVKEEMACGVAKPSYVSRLLEETSNSPTRVESENIIRAGAALMYEAGIDTTATTITSFFLAMTLFPDVYRKAQAEMDTVVSRSRLPTHADRPSLPYLESVLKETFRWTTPVPLGLPHQVTGDDEYRGYYIPGGSMIIANIWGMSRDPGMFPAPEVFDPDRFCKTVEDREGVLDPSTFVFGFGRRVCPGRMLADSSVWLIAANLVATMDIGRERDEAGREVIPVPEFVPGTVRHPKPFLCSIKPRHSKVSQLISQVSIDSK
ncbi:cytochrome P450 [Laetiporus sulphureus 93-53]|uniref:Cytochrome P450 n=1 Tax=Laetiporus sulphureus 93-53 TaxID=1314785 RepID=A0A165CPH7_9APHY|nr:cytochrome P450 [Laetiporus sulphureus 93-53]KZT03182.1 cytochrome P450 [Laetiporus sulphureus 93-53]